MNRHKWMRVSLAAMALVAAPAIAQDQDGAGLATADAATGRVVTDEARLVLDRMTGYLSGLDRFEVTMQGSRDEVLPFGYKLQNNETARMVVQRPNRFRIDVDGDIKHRSYYYDGSTLLNGLLNAGVELPMIDVLRQGFDNSLLDGVRYGLLVGEAPLEGTVTDHLAFRQPSIDWQMWVAGDGQPRKVLITTRYEVGDPQYQATMRWNLKPRIDAATFAYTPAEGMQEIEFHSTTPTQDGIAGGAP